MRKILSLLLAVAVAFVFTACQNQQPGRPGDTVREAVVDELKGSVTVTSNEDASPAFKGLALLRRDFIETDTASWSSLEFNEGQFVLIEENTCVEIFELADNLKKPGISLTGGKIWVAISNKLTDDESFEVKTPTCALSVRGTVFSVTCDKDGNTRIVVYEGVVNVQTENENFDLSNGSAEIIAEKGVICEIRKMELDASDAAPFYIKGTAGPAGVLDILRARLPRLTWDDDLDGFTIQESASLAIIGISDETAAKDQAQPPAQSQTQTRPQAQTQSEAQPQPQERKDEPELTIPLIAFNDLIYAAPLGSSFLIPYTVSGGQPDTITLSPANRQAGFSVDAANNWVYAPGSLAAGSYIVTATASNSAGESSHSCSLDVLVPLAPVIPQPLAPPKINLSFQSNKMDQGATYTAQFSATGSEPLIWSIDKSETHPPSGASIDGTGKLTIPGTAAAGYYLFMIRVSNDAGSDMINFEITVQSKAVQINPNLPINPGLPPINPTTPPIIP